MEIKSLENEIAKVNREKLIKAINNAATEVYNHASAICEEYGLYNEMDYDDIKEAIIDAVTNGYKKDVELTTQMEQSIRNNAINKFLKRFHDLEDKQEAVLKVGKEWAMQVSPDYHKGGNK